MLVAAAVCPHPPLLVPELGVGLGPEIDTLRAECADVVHRLHAAGPDLMFVVGAGGGLIATSFAPWGADVPVDVPEPLPLSVLVGGYLTRGTQRSFAVVDPAGGSDDCAALGAELAAVAERVVMLVMGDGSARHDEKAPGYIDARAPEWDETVHSALVNGDTSALLALDRHTRTCGVTVHVAAASFPVVRLFELVGLHVDPDDVGAPPDLGCALDGRSMPRPRAAV